MKIKTYLIFIVLLLIGSLLGTVDVNADTSAEDLLSYIPDKITLDIKEIEYEQASEMIVSQIKDIFKSNSVEISDLEIECYGINLITWKTGNIYSATISIKKSNGETITTKDVTINYSNSNNKNENDEKYISDIQLENPVYCEVEDWENYWFTEENYLLSWFSAIENYYSDLLNDSSLTIKAESGEGGDVEADIVIGIFKDGILYDIKVIGSVLFFPVITVPEDISNDKIEEYIVNLIKPYYSDFTGITKGCLWDADLYPELQKIENVYTLNDAFNTLVIVRRVGESSDYTGSNIVSSSDESNEIENIRNSKTIDELDNTPKTGTQINLVIFIITIVSIVLISVIEIVKKH